MSQQLGGRWAALVGLSLLAACGETSYEPTPARLVGEFSGRAGDGFQTYDLFLSVDAAGDSVRGLWSLAFLTSCSTHDGPFSGTLEGDRLKLRLRPDEGYESTFDVDVRVLPGDSVLTGNLSLVQMGGEPLCFEEYAPITLHYGEVNGLPIGR
jgi:hypothetical protein